MGRRVKAGFACVGAALALLGASPARADPDPPSDFLRDCDPSATPGPGGDPAMDLLNVTDTAGRRGDEHVFVADTNGDLKAYLDGDPESAAIVVLVYDPRTGLVTQLIEERHQGRARTEAEVDGKPSDVEVMTVIERGHIEFSATGLELRHDEWRWAVQANNLPGDGNFYCDQAGVGPDGKPALPPAPAAEPSSTTAPSASTSSPQAAPTRSSGGDDSGLNLWWIFIALGLVGGVVGLIRWFHWWLERSRLSGGGSHGAPTTPPPEQNDFGQ
ncbi:MAG: hypothetical protein HYU28_06075 [Actinobacteria bacterium]|nr:hypothetical protein [Actinomycetota bacterium]